MKLLFDTNHNGSAGNPGDKLRIAELESILSEQQRIAGMPFQRLYHRYKAYSAVPSSLRSKQVAFLHIGKTAGTSIHHLLRSALSDTSVYHGDQHSFDEIAAEDLADYGLVLGHFSFNHTKKMRHPLCLITFLRDPVERVLSSYYYLREAKSDSDKNSANSLAKSLSLSAFLDCENPEVVQFTVDHQCHALVSDWRALRENDRGKLVHEALANLRAFGFVGFVEYFERSVFRLCRMLEFDPAGRGLDLHMNRTKAREKKADIDPTVIAKIMALNAGDMLLYERARNEFLEGGPELRRF